MAITLTVGKIAARAGVSVDTIRYYERLGVLPKAMRTAAGYRMYPETVLNRLTVVRNAQRFGFSLREIAGFLRVRERGGAPCREVRAAAERMLAAVDRQIAELTQTRAQMHATLEDWDQRLAHTPVNVPARLLETLTTDMRYAGRRTDLNDDAQAAQQPGVSGSSQPRARLHRRTSRR